MKDKIKNLVDHKIIGGVILFVIVEFIKSTFPGKNIGIFSIILMGLILAYSCFVLLEEHKKLKKIVSIIILITAIIAAWLASHYWVDDSVVRLDQFEKGVIDIERKKLAAGKECEELVHALKIIQKGDEKAANLDQLKLLNRVKECLSTLNDSDYRWKQVRLSYIAFNSNRTLTSANEFITKMNELDELDRSRSTVKENDEYERKYQEVKADIAKLNEIMKSLKKTILNYRQHGQSAEMLSKIEVLLNEFENLTIHYKPGDLDPSQQQAVMVAYEIKNSKNDDIVPQKAEPNVEVLNKIKLTKEKEPKTAVTHQDVRKKDIFIDTSAIIDRNFLLLKDVLDKKFESKGFSLSPFQDVDILTIKIVPPGDNRAIKTFPIDSDGRIKYQVSFNVQLLLGSRGIDKKIGNIKMAGLGSSELEALQKAQENVSNEISDKVIDSLKKLNIL